MSSMSDRKVDDYKKCSEKYSDLRNKYLKVRREVEAWTPPTPEHDGLKKFALEQIDMCIPSFLVSKALMNLPISRRSL